MNTTRRLSVAAIGASLLAATALGTPSLGMAQPAYPSKPVRIVNNFPPGGPLDILARSAQPILQELLKQPIVVENKSGAAGNIGAADVQRAAADGHTVLFSIDTTFTVNPHIYKSMPFKPADFKPVLVMASSGLMVGVHPSTGYKSMKALVDAGKAREVSFSSAGNGSPGHLAVEVLRDSVGLKIKHIPYRGNTPAVTAVLAGEVDGGSLATPGMVPHTQAGKIVPLAVTSNKRSQLAPDVPTVAELGYKELTQEILYIVMVPAATPEPVVKTLENSLLEALKRPEVQERLNSLDLQFEGITGAAAAKRLADTSARYAKTIAATGMTVE
jgi:tripartite-type tricarboxylate transporter receptor subunit TctC